MENREMRVRTILSLLVSAFVLQMPIADHFGAVALAAGPTSDVCHDAAPLARLPADDGVSAQPLDAAKYWRRKRRGNLPHSARATPADRPASSPIEPLCSARAPR